VITREFRADRLARSQRSEILHIRHHSLYAPRDVDLSPSFHVVKPTLEAGFDYRRLHWSDQRADAAGALAPSSQSRKIPAENC
jgi:hypothetical protein